MASTTDLFINLIQNHPIVYNKTLKDFKNTRKKDEAWTNIADQSRMSVEGAKKRYASLRQKYCREKRNLEVKRRNKLVNRKYWVFYERLHFLDSFIQPRATFTNDTGFEENFAEELDEEMIDGEVDEIENLNGGNVDASQNINIEVDESINANELNIFFRNDDDYNQQATGDDLEGLNNNSEEILSDYTGEVSRIDYQSMPTQNGSFSQNNDSTTVATEDEHIAEPCDLNNHMSPHPTSSSAHNNAMNHNLSSQGFVTSLRHSTADKTASTNSTTAAVRRATNQNIQLPINSHDLLAKNISGNVSTVATEVEDQIIDPIDIDNYVSPDPSTSSACSNVVIRSSSSQEIVPSSRHSTGVKTTSANSTSAVVRRPINQNNHLPLNTNGINSTISSSQKQMQPSSIPAPNTLRQNVVHHSSMSSQNVSQNTSSTKKSAPLRTITSTSTSNEKSMEAIRHKMDSCLNAISNKMTDKPQRSPYAPFLAYLGTKLPNVPKEIISNVEREILDLVEHHSK